MNELARRHLVVGWTAIAAYLAVGLVLEALHGFKVGWYLDVSNETRRLLLTLGHSHGVLLGLVNLGLALTAPHLGELPGWTSRALVAATILLPGGFFLGGLVLHGNDPGLGILFVPVGGVLLLAATVAIARAARG